jgi:hypothetical protein
MDHAGKVVYVRNSEVLSLNLQSAQGDIVSDALTSKSDCRFDEQMMKALMGKD